MPTNFDTAEYRRSDGPEQHNVIAAWQKGVTGKGVAIGIVDTGIDPDNPEFAGRLSAASADVAGNRVLESEDGHGTQVALIAAAARNDTGVVGIAYDATIIALRADTPGSCATEDPEDPSTGCTFGDRAIAAGIDRAADAGARVVNLSLGGGRAGREVRDAVARAAAMGVVVVVSAGNDGASTDADIDPDNPDPFATDTLSGAPANVIIAGSVDADNRISDFSNRAGSFAASFLSARGGRVCCVYENGEVFTTEEDGTSFVYVVSGTSFAAPQISGAVALLAQAFPNLSGDRIVEILLNSARDLGDPGADAIYGRGLLDIAAAFAPQGATTLAGSATPVSLSDIGGTTGTAMGDAAGRARIGAVILDGYDRAYAMDFAASLKGSSPTPRLHRAMAGATRNLSFDAGNLALGFTISDDATRAPDPVSRLTLNEEQARQAQVLAARMSARLAPDTKIAVGFRQGAEGLQAMLQGAQQPAFMIAGDARGELGVIARTDAALALRRELGDFGLTLSAEGGTLWQMPDRDALRDTRLRPDRMTRFAATLDRRWKDVDLGLSLGWMAEDRTILGSRFHAALGQGGADSMMLDGGFGWNIGDRWRLGGGYRHTFTHARESGAVAQGSRLSANAWNVDLERRGVLGSGDALALRVSQPLRVTGGGVRFNLPVSWDYDREEAIFGIRTLALAPTGREIATEIAWRGHTVLGDVAASLYYRTDPCHIAGFPADRGVAMRWSRRF
ncbi:S8 family peptidase [Croceicoccus hydrothermalis]|uniref:S8 family peptidase n=1 Tax=Croceicoccus hydrothermalis TaxID=2867964 RepID=UPI001EFBFA4D